MADPRRFVFRRDGLCAVPISPVIGATMINRTAAEPSLHEKRTSRKLEISRARTLREISRLVDSPSHPDCTAPVTVEGRANGGDADQ